MTPPRDPVQIGNALHQAASPLLRQIRKQQAYKAFLAALPEEIQGLCAPSDLRLAPLNADMRASLQAPADTSAQASTLFVLAANQAVAIALQARAQALIETVNKALPYPMVEAFHVEQAPLARIERHLNNLAVRPD